MSLPSQCYNMNFSLSSFRYAVAFSDRKFKKILKDLGCTETSYEFLSKSGAGQVVALENSSGHLFCIISLRSREFDISAIGTVIHEAVHVWQRFSDYIGEQNADEFEAYFISEIARTILAELKQPKKAEPAPKQIAVKPSSEAEN